jgi:hypothetical protein
MAIKFSFKSFLLLGFSKCITIGIFGMQMYHLATLYIHTNAIELPFRRVGNHHQLKMLLSILKQGCQIFLGTNYQNGKNIPNNHELYRMTIKYNKRPSVHQIYHHLPLQDPPKFTQIWILGLKTNRLATLF